MLEMNCSIGGSAVLVVVAASKKKRLSSADQSEGAALMGPPPLSLAVPYARVKSDYFTEAVQSPGVKLVAHAIA